MEGSGDRSGDQPVNELHIKAARDSLARSLRNKHPELLADVTSELEADLIADAVNELITAHLMAFMAAQVQR